MYNFKEIEKIEKIIGGNKFDLTLFGQWYKSKNYPHDWGELKNKISRKEFFVYVNYRENYFLESKHLLDTYGGSDLQGYKNFIAQQGYKLRKQYDTEDVSYNHLGV